MTLFISPLDLVTQLAQGTEVISYYLVQSGCNSGCQTYYGFSSCHLLSYQELLNLMKKLSTLFFKEHR